MPEGGEVRKLSYVIDLIDRATKPLKNIVAIADQTDNRKTTLEVGVEGYADSQNKMGKLQGSVGKLTDLGNKMGEGLKGAGEKMALAGSQIQKIWDPATQSFYELAEASEKASEKLEDTTKKMGPMAQKAKELSNAIESVQYQLLVVQGAATMFMYSSINAAMKTERWATITKGAFGDRADEILEWAEAGSKLTSVTNDSRLAMAQMFNQAKMGNKEIMETSELVEKYWKNKALRAKLQEAGISSKESFAEQIKNIEIGGGRAFGLRQVWGKEALESLIENGHGAKKVLSLMRKDLEKTADTVDDTTSAQADFAEVWNEFLEDAGMTLLPVVQKIYLGLTKLIMLIQNIPGAPGFVVIAAAATFLSISLIFLLGVLAQSYLALAKLAGQLGITSLAMKGATISTYAHSVSHKAATAAIWLSTGATHLWTLSQVGAARAATLTSGAIGVLISSLTALKVAMLSNPVTAALVILLAVLLLLEAKFHIFSNLFKGLDKVNWAEKWAEGVKYLSGLFDGLIGKATWLKNLVSGGTDILKKIGGGNVGLGGIMLAIPGIGIMVSTLKMMNASLKYLLQLSGGNLQFLQDISGSLKDKFGKTIDLLESLIPGWLQNIFQGVDDFTEWLKTAWDRLIEGINSFLTSLGLNPIEGAPKRGLTEEGLSAAEKDRILRENLTAYNISEAAGSKFGTPAVGAGEVEAWQPAFEGKFKEYGFESTRYPNVSRTGEELTKEQLMTGEWTPKSFNMMPLTDEQIQMFYDAIAAAKEQQPIVIEKEEPKAEPINIIPPHEISSGKSKEEILEDISVPPSSGELSMKTGEPTPEEALKEASITQTVIQRDVPFLPTEEGKKEEKKEESIIDKVWNAIVNPLGRKEEDKTEEEPEPSKPKESSSSGESDTSAASSSESKKPSAGESKESTRAAYESRWNRAEEGGIISRTGRGTLHKGEEVISEEDKLMYNTGEVPTILRSIDSITRQIKGAEASVAVKSGDKVINLNFYSPLMRIEKVVGEVDFSRAQTAMVRFIRDEVRSAIKG
jgi:hypothetical protein